MFKRGFAQACVFIANKKFNSVNTEGKYDFFVKQFEVPPENLSKKRFLQFSKKLVEFSRKKKYTFKKEAILSEYSPENWLKLGAEVKKRHTPCKSCICLGCEKTQVILFFLNYFFGKLSFFYRFLFCLRLVKISFFQNYLMYYFP